MHDVGLLKDSLRQARIHGQVWCRKFITAVCSLCRVSPASAKSPSSHTCVSTPAGQTPAGPHLRVKHRRVHTS
eukprot:357968-Chlamydomonas_euryale.AAC.1